MHNFKVPARLRADSDGMLQHNQTTASNIVHNQGCDSSGSDAMIGGNRALNDSVSARAVDEEPMIAHHSAFSSGTEEESKTPRSQRHHSSRSFQQHLKNHNDQKR